MKYCIVTYHRNKIHTTDTLLRHGVAKKDISIATQDAGDFTRVLKTYAGTTVLFDENVHNVAGNRNQLLDHYSTEDYILLLDDDILDMQLEGRQLPDVMDECVEFMKLHNISCLNFSEGNPDNPYFDNTLMDWAMDGRMLLVEVGQVPKFREDFDVCEDTVFALETILSGRHVAFTSRFYITSKPCSKDSDTEGGCSQAYNDGKFDICYNRMVEEFPQFFLHTWQTIFMWTPSEVIRWD